MAKLNLQELNERLTLQEKEISNLKYVIEILTAQFTPAEFEDLKTKLKVWKYFDSLPSNVKKDFEKMANMMFNSFFANVDKAKSRGLKTLIDEIGYKQNETNLELLYYTYRNGMQYSRHIVKLPLPLPSGVSIPQLINYSLEKACKWFSNSVYSCKQINFKSIGVTYQI